ncbi:MAG: hypothetical protein Q4E63_04085 [Prevotellaceae bacterium]|nr:hypothetical protein [Prevotellaceae bacterium]
MSTRIIHSLVSRVMMWLLVSLLWSCHDDFFADENMLYGEAIVNIEASFEPFSAMCVNSGTTRAYAGNVMGELSDMALLAYDEDGNLLRDYPMALDFTQEDVKDEDRVNADATTDTTSERTTKCLMKELKMSYGTYYLIAVANMGEYNKDGSVKRRTIDMLTDMGSSSYDTLDKLRALKRKWDTGNIYNNRVMMGFFVDKSASASAPSSQDDFMPVTVNRSAMSLRTWLRRAASKVTVDFDGTGLRENVKIYIHDVKIYDIPKTCTVGFGKKKLQDNSYLSFNNAVKADADSLHNDGQVIEFGSGDEYSQWPVIAKGSPYIMDTNGGRADFHSNSSPSLFFYENMQGDAPEGKGPVVDLVNGGVANSNTLKDDVPYGTYIEVRAHYVSEASGNISNGEIKYRFLLGKDADKNCDAERNHHYKVTLKFNGNANEYSWHVDYKEEPDTWDVPQPWYVSYLYNHQSTIPFKYTPEEGYEVVYFEAEIINNPWQPDEDDNIPIPPESQGAFAETRNKRVGNGFLSLRKTMASVVTPQMCGETKWPGYDKYPPNATVERSIGINDEYFYGRSAGSKGINRAKRTFYVDGSYNPSTVPDSLKEEIYSFQKKGQSVSVNMPLFTRAKVLIKETGYSGNNPYVGYTRTADISMTPYVRRIGTKDKPTAANSKIINVQQVRRIVNPKGVYRRSDNFAPFHVHLLTLPGEGAEKFKDFKSDGPWMAEVLGDKNFITLDGKQQVHGSTETSIEFNINFNRLNNDNKVRNAIVRVRYNSYTCTHLIFVRQGYDPQAISPTAKDYNHRDGNGPAVRWRTFNRISANLDATDPRDEGSLFKFGNTSQPIDAVNNCYGDKDYDGVLDGVGIYYKHPANWYGVFTNEGEYLITQSDGSINNIVSGQRVNWKTIKKNDGGFTDVSWANMATMRHYEQLYTTRHVQFGYGVLYADGATKTLENVNDAYGYYRRDPDNINGTDSEKGMRGVFAYYFDADNPTHEFCGKNVFFPIGRSGFGHRKQGNGTKEDSNYQGLGILRYCSNGHGERGTTFNMTAPLFAALYYRPGAIYYSKQTTNQFLIWTGEVGSEANDGIATGMDMNYFTFDVNMIGSVNLSYGEDACMVRFVAP